MLLVMLLLLLDSKGDGGDDNMEMMMIIDLLHTMTAGTRDLLYFNLSFHSPLMFLHNDPVVRKHRNTYPLLELAQLGRVVFPLHIIDVTSDGIFYCFRCHLFFRCRYHLVVLP